MPPPLKNAGKLWSLLFLALILVIGAGVFFWLRQPDEATVRALTNQGIAEMERFEYTEAGKKFEDALSLDPSNLDLKINLGIAQLNQATDDSLARSIRTFQEVLKRDPENLNAKFCLGIIAYYQNRSEDAAREFQAVLDKDPNDAFSWFYLGKFHPEGPDSAAALNCLNKALELDPYLNAARYALALHPLLENPDLRKKLLEEHERLKQAEWERTQDIAYTQMGPYASVLGGFKMPRDGSVAAMPVFRREETSPIDLGPDRTWAGEEAWPNRKKTTLFREVRDRFGGCLCLADFQKNGLPDAFLGGAILDKGQIADLYIVQTSPGKWRTIPLPLPPGWFSWGAVAADLDNDGHTDLAVCGPQGIRFLRNKGDGEFELKTPPGISENPVFGIRAIDLDQDGDLDLIYVVLGQSENEALDNFKGQAKGPGAGLIRAFLNQGEAPPTPPDRPLPALSWAWATAPESLFPKFEGAIHLMLADPDNDGDLDLIAFSTGKRASIIFNDRLLRFSGPMAFGPEDSHPTSGLFVDIDMDGFSDILLNGPDTTPALVLCKPSGTPGKPVLVAGIANGPAMRQAVIADIDRNGSTDIIGLVGTGRTGLIRNTGGRLNFDQNSFTTSQNSASAPILASLMFTDGDGDGRPDLWLWYPNRGLEYRINKGNGNQGLRVLLTGKRDKGDTLRTNNDAIGAKMEALEGSIRTTMELATLYSGPSQSMVPVDLGVGRALEVTALRIRWPDRVVQAEINLSTSKLHTISETNRKATSCPVLFLETENGMTMVTDLLGAGAIGEQGPGGTVRPPRPTESLWIEPKGNVSPGKPIRISLAEPMDEVMYLDQVKLQVVDLPEGWTATADERFVFSGPQPSGSLLVFPVTKYPKWAKKLDGRDCTEELSKRDGIFPRDYPLRSWLGFADNHGWEMAFESLDQKPGDRVYLILDAWTDYPYPESLYAAAQAGINAKPLTLEIPDGKGGWKTALELGVPAGLPKQMAVEVTGLGSALNGPMRISTNLRVGVDAIRLGRLARSEEKAQVIDLGLQVANLAKPGLFKEAPTRDGLFQYRRDQVESPRQASVWSGELTRLGEVTPLLAAKDDLLLVGGPGDEVTLEFAPPPAPKPGTTRGYFLKVDGYCKDTAPFTKKGGAVRPWPFSTMGDFPADVSHPREMEMKEWTNRRP